MAPYAFYPEWAAPRRFVHDRSYYYEQGGLNNDVNRPTKSYSKRTNKKVWRVKLPGSEKPSIDDSANPSKDIAVAPSSNVVPSENIAAVPSGDAVPSNGAADVLSSNAASSKEILALTQGPMANDHDVSTRKAKTRDPKYTQPQWCPPGLTRTQKRRLQRLRNHEKEEQQEEKKRDELCEKIRPRAPTRQIRRRK